MTTQNESERLAINFGEWLLKLSPAARVSVWSKDGQYSGLFNMDSEQLFEKYKNQVLKIK